MKNLQSIHPVFFLLIATILEVSGDAIIRICIYNHTGFARIVYGILGAFLLFGYGLLLNLAPVEFSQVVGLYIAVLFVVWQIINYFIFKSVPSLPILIGGIFVVTGGLIITFWKPD